jgi:hypothetical protein
MFKNNFPDYNRISEIEKERLDINRKLERARYYDEEAHNKELQLAKELGKLVMGEKVEVEGKSCKENHCHQVKSDVPIYYPGKVHHLDGDTDNESFGNLAMVCPNCQAHILLSRFDLEDIWLLKARGLSNAEIGRLLDISRERVRQLCEKYQAKHEAELTSLSNADLDELVKKAEDFENQLIYSGRLRRRIDRRTKKKRIVAELAKLKAQQKEK